MDIRTTSCAIFRQREFLIRCDDSIPNGDVDWLVQYLERSVSDGRVYQSGELVQIGWMLDRLSDLTAETLLLSEPDMRSIPIEWTEGVTHTLRHVRLQKDTAESIGAGEETLIPTILESALIGNDVGFDTEDVVFERGDLLACDSGWFVGSLFSRFDYNDPRNLRRISLYEAAIACPRIIMFLSLPVGTRIECRRREISVFRNGHSITPRRDSFLERFVTQLKDVV